MADVTTLVLAVDSRQARTAASDLDRLGGAGSRAEKSADRVAGAFRSLNGLLGGVTATLAVRATLQAADAYANLNARLRLVTAGSAEFARAQTEVFRVAQATSAGLTETADLYGSLARSTESLGVSQERVISVTESINKAIAVSSTNAQGAAAALTQLGQGFASGTLRGEELNSVLAQAPRLARAIADGLGVTVGQLRALGAEGQLTGEKVFTALERSGGAIDREFAQLPLTIGRATTQASNALIKLIGVIDDTSGASQSLAGIISDAAGSVSTFADEIRRVTEGQEDVGLLAEAFVTVQETVQVLAAEIAFVLSGTGREIGAIAAQIAALARLDIQGFNAISEAVREDAVRARAELDRFTRDVLGRLPDLGQSDSRELARRGRAAEPFGNSAGAAPPPARSGRQRDPFADAIKNLREQIGLVGKVTELEQLNARIALGNFGKLSAAQQERLRGLAAELDAVNALQDQADARLEIDLGGIQRQLATLTSAYGAAESILDAQRQAGIVSERDYFNAKKSFIAASEAAQVNALQAETDRLRQEVTLGKDAIQNQRTIAENEQRIAEIRIDAGAQTAVLAIQQQAYFASIEAGTRAARDSLESYLESLRRGQALEVSGLGLGNRERERLGGRAQVEDRFEQQRRDLQRSRREAEFAGNFGPDQQRRYDEELRLIAEFQRSALASFDSYYQQRLAKESSFNVGASEALRNYVAEAENVAKLTEDAFNRAFGNLEDTITDFIVTGRGSFKSFADGIVRDITSAIVKNNLASLFNIAAGAGQGGALGFLGDLGASLFGGAPRGSAATGAAGAVAGAATGAFDAAASAAQTAALTAAITTSSAAETAAISGAITASSAAEVAAISGAITATSAAETAAVTAALVTSSATETAAITAAIAASTAAITTAIAASAATTGAGGGVSSLLSAVTGGRAIGGPVSAGGLYEINEEGGPGEILNAGGKQYLLAAQSGSVSPQGASGGGGSSVNVTINQTFAAGTDRRTVDQAAARAAVAVQRAARIT